MSKAILVIDTPKFCIDCPCHFAGVSGQVWCGKENKELLADDIQKFKPDWCPLRDVPEKDWEDYGDDEFYEGQKLGWNYCIDTILRGA